MPFAGVMAEKKTLPYWLAGGTETCELCGHRHVREMQHRCAACDRPNCEHCVVVDRETGEVLCHECLQGDGEED